MKPFLLIIALMLPVSFVQADELLGWDNGNAGDTYAAEFILTARDVIERMKTLPSSELAGIDMLALQGAIGNTQVHSEETLLLNGYEVDAINYPGQATIKISRNRWRSLRHSSETRNRLILVLHEYLFMAGKDDSQFVLSARIIPLMDVKNYHPGKWWAPLNPANRITTSLEYAPRGCKISSLNFDLSSVSEQFTLETTGDCGDAYRKVSVTKSSLTSPPSSYARGTFHRYEISVSDKSGALIGAFTYEPEWGKCLLPQDGTCRLSGKMSVGGVEFIFWLLRN